MMRKVLTLLIAGLVSCFFAESATAQAMAGRRYPKGRLFLSNGSLVEGRNVIVGAESVTMDIGGMVKAYQLSEVQQIMVKRGLGPKWAGGCAGGCAALCLLNVFLWETEGDEYQYEAADHILYSAIYVSIFSAGGYLVGYLLDDWKPIYLAPRGAYIPGQLQPQLASGRLKSDLLAFCYGLRF